MKKNKLFIITLSLILICFFVFFKGLNKSNIYVPSELSGKKIFLFDSKTLFTNQKININDLIIEDKIYLLNIWSSWCIPCIAEHKILMELSKNSSIEIIGLNYKDNLFNAKKFIDELGNPYSEILIDKNGIISIELGAYGVPETLIFDKDKIILKKIIGPLNNELLKKIKFLTK